VDYNKNGGDKFLFDPYIFHGKPERLLCIPIKIRGDIRSLIYIESYDRKIKFDKLNTELLVFLGTHLTVSIEREYFQQFKQKLEKQNEEKLLKLMQAEKMSSVGLILSEVVHEVNSPNYCISLNAEALSEMWSDLKTILNEYVDDDDLTIGNIRYEEFLERYPQIVKSIRVSSRQIDSIVRELRDFTEPRSFIKKERVDINKAIESTILIAGPFIKKATKKFRYIPRQLPPVRGDTQKIQQVLLNVIKNGCEALSSNEKAVTVRTDLDATNKEVIINIRDEGEGIENGLLSKIVEPLFTTKEKKNGMGLGLYVSNAIVKAHNGFLDIESRPGIGTSVSIHLPVLTGSLE
jgi:polar amino acid transport system substrate-binding protein